MSVKSVRVGSVHITIEGARKFKSINEAKRHSRSLGGAKNVRAFEKRPSEAELDQLLKLE